MNCRDCGVALDTAGMSVRSHLRHWCRSCLAAKRKRENVSGWEHYRWRGGRSVKSGQRYIRVWVAPGVRRLEHTEVWERHHGAIPDGWQVHHIDGDHANNAIENLALLTNVEHQRWHKRQR